MIDGPWTTKCVVLKEASKLFDPLGIASPVSVRAKVLMQKLWQLHVEWDEPLDATVKEEWSAILTDIQQLPKLNLKWHFFQDSFTPAKDTLQMLAPEHIVQSPSSPIIVR